jgi:hypothetical protein
MPKFSLRKLLYFTLLCALAFTFYNYDGSIRFVYESSDNHLFTIDKYANPTYKDQKGRVNIEFEVKLPQFTILQFQTNNRWNAPPRFALMVCNVPWSGWYGRNFLGNGKAGDGDWLGNEGWFQWRQK